MEKFTYAPVGVCSKRIEVEITDGVIHSVKFVGGCDGNLQGISRLVMGQRPEAVVQILKGIDCRGRGTSCPDQLARALEAHI